MEVHVHRWIFSFASFFPSDLLLLRHSPPLCPPPTHKLPPRLIRSFAYYRFRSRLPHSLVPPPLCLPPSASPLPAVSNLLPDFFILPPPSLSSRSPSPTRSLTAYRVVAFSHLGETLKINEGCAGIWVGAGVTGRQMRSWLRRTF